MPYGHGCLLCQDNRTFSKGIHILYNVWMTVALPVNHYLLMTYALVLLVIVHVTLSKISILFGAPFLTESGCKGKEFQAYLPNIWGSFFSLFPGGLQRSLAKGKDTGKNPDRDQDSKHRRFVFKSGCKGKKFQAYPPNFFRSFFGVFFQGSKPAKHGRTPRLLPTGTA